jgi:hypothetical protein
MQDPPTSELTTLEEIFHHRFAGVFLFLGPDLLVGWIHAREGLLYYTIDVVKEIVVVKAIRAPIDPDEWSFLNGQKRDGPPWELLVCEELLIFVDVHRKTAYQPFAPACYSSNIIQSCSERPVVELDSFCGCIGHGCPL